MHVKLKLQCLYTYYLAVFPGQPGSISDDAEFVTLVGSNQDAADQINRKEVLWGVSHICG